MGKYFRVLLQVQQIVPTRTTRTLAQVPVLMIRRWTHMILVPSIHADIRIGQLRIAGEAFPENKE